MGERFDELVFEEEQEEAGQGGQAQGHDAGPWFGFFAFFGFGAYVFIVLSAKALRRLIKRPEDYYERSGEGGSDD